MTPKPEQEWRACLCAAGDPQHRPPDGPMRPCSVLGDMWYHTRDMSLWVGWDICQRCPVPDCAEALREAELQMAWIVTETSDPGPSARPSVETMNKCHDALAKLRGTP